MCTFPSEEKKKSFFVRITAFLDFEILQFLDKTQWNVYISIPSRAFMVSTWNFAQMIQAY